jgi:hypothetical protein
LAASVPLSISLTRSVRFFAAVHASGYGIGSDPVQLGLVASLNRPGGNLTGFSNVVGELGAKGLALLHELVPNTATVGFLENPNNPAFELTTRDVLAAAPVHEPERCSSVTMLFSTTGLSGLFSLRHTTQFRLCIRIVSS